MRLLVRARTGVGLPESDSRIEPSLIVIRADVSAYGIGAGGAGFASVEYRDSRFIRWTAD